MRWLPGTGRNYLQTEMANLWANRLIGGVQPGVAKKTFAERPAYAPTASLLTSGLLGPVRIRLHRMYRYLEIRTAPRLPEVPAPEISPF